MLTASAMTAFASDAELDDVTPIEVLVGFADCGFEHGLDRAGSSLVGFDPPKLVVDGGFLASGVNQ